ncbi:hypothetical protein [Mesobacillus boroniphilus]|uniref:hypothetical protein n=1 Tax=Mesobacillus boroniphilus TaxID=308892 RepID=UPI00138EE70F|nr:hypothetical protein [Mesobacillus boroniphilus]
MFVYQEGEAKARAGQPLKICKVLDFSLATPFGKEYGLFLLVSQIRLKVLKVSLGHHFFLF